jgi:hypothetical protein
MWKGIWPIRTNLELQIIYNNRAVIWDIQIRILQRLGHVVRMENFRLPKKILHAKLDKRQERDILKLRCFDDFKTGITTLGIKR